MNSFGLTELQAWYIAQCDGAWEHTYGIKIETLDNPGWMLRVDLVETELAGRAFDRVEVERFTLGWNGRFSIRRGVQRTSSS